MVFSLSLFLAANVWETCEAVKSPMTNKAALFKRLGGALKSVNDAMREVSRALANAHMGSVWNIFLA